MADVKAIIQDCSVGFSILPESGCSVSGALMPEAVVRHHSSAAGVAAAILSVALAISVVDLPTSSPRGIFIQSISEAEVALMSNFKTLDGFFIKTADGKIFFVAE